MYFGCLSWDWKPGIPQTHVLIEDAENVTGLRVKRNKDDGELDDFVPRRIQSRGFHINETGDASVVKDLLGSLTGSEHRGDAPPPL